MNRTTGVRYTCDVVDGWSVPLKLIVRLSERGSIGFCVSRDTCITTSTVITIVEELSFSVLVVLSVYAGRDAIEISSPLLISEKSVCHFYTV